MNRIIRSVLLAALAVVSSCVPSPPCQGSDCPGAGGGTAVGGGGGGAATGGGGQASTCGNGTLDAPEVCDDGNSVGGDGCEADCTFTDTASVKGCAGLNASVHAAQSCSVTAGDGARLITGIILTDGVTYVGGQVLLDGSGAITCAGCDCTATAGASTATHLVCPQVVVSPGLINAHDHISFQANPAMGTAERYEHRHDWRLGQDGHTRVNNGGNATNAQIRWAELRQLMAGTTAIVGATYTTNGNAGLLRNLDSAPAGQQGSLAGASGVNSDTFPLKDTGGLELTSGCGYPAVPTAAPGTSAYLPHISEGIEASAANEFACLSQAGGVGVLSARTAIVHGIALSANDIALAAQTGTSLVWSPRSNVSLYGDTAAIPLYRRLGVNIALGTDWTISGSMNLLRELRCADSLNQTRFNHALSDEALWRAVTANGADATVTAASIGRIAVGRLGDLAFYRRKPGVSFYRSIIEANPEDVVLTIRGGKVLYGDAAVVAAFDDAMQCETFDVCGTSKAACVQGELAPLTTGSNAANTLALLQMANATTYPLFACGEPAGEPSCVPERAATSPKGTNSKNGSTVYTQASTDTDFDGIDDSVDNCPTIFNPVRPMDNGHQADADDDQVGDVCDVCPLNANTTTCTMFDPNDRDRDGVVNASDNCPVLANAGQEDADTDGQGDVCDACPMVSNPGGAPCPATIYAIKNGTVPAGQRVALHNVLVTGVGPNGYFLQVADTDPEFTTRDYSGLFVYKPTPEVTAGDRIEIASGTPANFFGQIQLTGTGSVGDGGVVIVSSGNTLPNPEIIDPAAAANNTNGLGAKFEGVLVRVDNAMVVNVTPDAGPGDKAPINEFVIAGDLRINDYLYLVSPFPVVGTQYQSITGVLELRSGAYKIEPRSDADVISGPAVLTPFDSSLVYLREGQSVTLPGPLLARLSHVETGDTAVTVSSAGPEVAVADGGLIVVPAGQLSAEIPLTGVTATDGGLIAVTATLGSSSQTANVRVLSASETSRLVSLTPLSAVVTAGSMQRFTLQLDIPGMSDTNVTIAVVPNTLGVAPVNVVIPADQTSATFEVAVDTLAVGSGTVSATLGLDSFSATVTVQAVPATTNLVISEFSPRGAAGGFDEFIELYNPTDVAVDLGGWKLQTKSAASTSWTDRVVFPGDASMAPHRYLLTANTAYAGPAADFAWLSPTSGLGDTGAIRLVRVVAGVDEVVDAVAFGPTATGGEGTPLPAHPGTTKATSSFERKAKASSDETSMSGSGVDAVLGNGQDTDDNVSDFYLRATSTRDPQNSASPTEP